MVLISAPVAAMEPYATPPDPLATGTWPEVAAPLPIIEARTFLAPIVVALPELVTSPVKLALVVTVAAFPVTLPAIGAVTVRVARVPTEVREDAVTPDDRVDPVSVPAAAVTVIAAVPSKATPLMFRAVASFVAVPALPDTVVWSPVLVPERLEPPTVPEAATEVGVMAPRVKASVGVEVGEVTEAETPFWVVTETEVTVPEPAPFCPGAPMTEIFQLVKVPEPLVDVEEMTRTPVEGL